jgi:hypothetical protein
MEDVMVERIGDSDDFPQIAQVDHASPETARVLGAYFAAKSKHHTDETMSFFAPGMITYTDAVLGWSMNDFAALKGVFDKIMPKSPAALSYPVRILGGRQSALVEFINTKEFFGTELRELAAVDFKDGKIVRWIDYWDGNTLDAKEYQQMRVPQEKFPTDFQEQKVGEDSSDKIRNVSVKLQNALAIGDAHAAAALFSAEGVYGDRVVHSEILGQLAIERYLDRILTRAPFGTGAKLRHVLGGDRGGGFEWTSGHSSNQQVGVTALELNSGGKITRLTTVYDGRQLSRGTLDELATLSIEQ